MLCGWRTVRYAEFDHLIPPPTFAPSITPYTATYTIGDPPIQFNAFDFIDILGVGNRAVIWTLDKTGATISSTGSFTATVAGTYTITAASKDDGTKRATATVTVIDP
jgi:uncharacterized protein YjdB